MSRFEGLMDDDDDYSNGVDSGSDDAITTTKSKFDGLMSDSDEGDDNEPAPIQTPIAAPPPPPPSTKKNVKKKGQDNDDDDDELAFLEKLAAQNKKNPEPVALAAPKKLELNIAKELNERFFDTTFDDSIKLPKNSSINKFITKRKNWPNLIPSSFNVTEASSNNGKNGKKRNKNKNKAETNDTNSQHRYSITLSDYGQSCKKNFAILQKNLNIDIMLYKLRSDPFDFELLMGIARYHLFRKEFQEATELVLRLTFIVQQTIPSKFIYNTTKFQSNTDFYNVIEFIARFAFRRGCNYTSTELWKFAVSIVENDDPNCFYLCAAVPALFSSDLEFIENILSKSTLRNQSSESETDNNDYLISFRGIPISFIPDWTVCQALLYLTEKNDNSKMAKVCALWPDIFTEMKEDDTVEITIDKNMPQQLQRLCIALKRRLKPIVMKDEVQAAVRQLEEKIKSEDVKDEKEKIFKKWSDFKDDIDVTMIVEEDALPVNPFNN